MTNEFKPAAHDKLLLKPFRDKHGFTQDQLAMLLDVTRAQLSMAESRSGRLSRGASEKFIKLQEEMNVTREQDEAHEWEKQEAEKRQAFTVKCKGQLLEMQYKRGLIQQQLPDLATQEQEHLAVIRHWESLPEAVKAMTVPYISIEIIVRRCIAKLAKCDLSARLDKQLQLKILEAQADVLKQFLACEDPA